MVKASEGGGGKGIRKATNMEDERRWRVELEELLILLGVLSC